MGEKSAYKVLVKKSEGKNQFDDLNLDGRIILKRTFRKWHGEHVID
jgi:hypothetical protein